MGGFDVCCLSCTQPTSILHVSRSTASNQYYQQAFRQRHLPQLQASTSLRPTPHVASLTLARRGDVSFFCLDESGRGFDVFSFCLEGHARSWFMTFWFPFSIPRLSGATTFCSGKCEEMEGGPAGRKCTTFVVLLCLIKRIF